MEDLHLRWQMRSPNFQTSKRLHTAELKRSIIRKKKLKHHKRQGHELTFDETVHKARKIRYWFCSRVNLHISKFSIMLQAAIGNSQSLAIYVQYMSATSFLQWSHQTFVWFPTTPSFSGMRRTECVIYRMLSWANWSWSYKQVIILQSFTPVSLMLECNYLWCQLQQKKVRAALEQKKAWDATYQTFFSSTAVNEVTTHSLTKE